MDIRYPMARLSPAKTELVVIEFSRADIEANYLDTALARLQVLVDDNEAAEKWEGSATFFFSGWDDDPRETGEISAGEEKMRFGMLQLPRYFSNIRSGNICSPVKS